MSAAVVVREELPGDVEAIRRVHDLAFGAPGEGKLVDRLREDGLIIASAVAEISGRIVGHALFSQLTIERMNESLRSAALAPVAVVPEWQGKGVGSAVIRFGVELCRERRCTSVLVLGNPAYYRKFGFSPERAGRLESKYSGPHFMAIEFTDGILAGGGVVHYPAAFELVD